MENETIHTSYTRKRIDLKLPEIILAKVSILCHQKAIDRTNYIETLIRMDLKRRNILVEEVEKKDYGTFEDWGWEEKPKLRKVIG